MTPVEKLEAAIAKLEAQASGHELDWFADPLFVTLHRTIDAQLDYLRFARSIAGAQMTGEQYAFIVDFGVEFSDAILGEVS